MNISDSNARWLTHGNSLKSSRRTCLLTKPSKRLVKRLASLESNFTGRSSTSCSGAWLASEIPSLREETPQQGEFSQGKILPWLTMIMSLTSSSNSSIWLKTKMSEKTWRRSTVRLSSMLSLKQDYVSGLKIQRGCSLESGRRATENRLRSGRATVTTRSSLKEQWSL